MLPVRPVQLWKAADIVVQLVHLSSGHAVIRPKFIDCPRNIASIVVMPVSRPSVTEAFGIAVRKLRVSSAPELKLNRVILVQSAVRIRYVPAG